MAVVVTVVVAAVVVAMALAVATRSVGARHQVGPSSKGWQDPDFGAHLLALFAHQGGPHRGLLLQGFEG